MAIKMNSQSVVLLDLISKHNFKKIAEVGVWKGHTEKNILRNTQVDEYWAIDSWNVLGDEHGRMGKSRMTLEHWDKMYFRVIQDMTWFPSLKVVRGKSEQVCELFPKEYFDLVFLDASHFYKDIKLDIKLWYPLVKKGGMLTGHDYKSKKHTDVTKAVLDSFSEELIIDFGSLVWGVYAK